MPSSPVLRGQAETARARALAASTDDEARAIIGEMNARILDVLRKPLSGPPLNLMPFDVEQVVLERKGNSSAGR